MLKRDIEVKTRNGKTPERTNKGEPRRRLTIPTFKRNSKPAVTDEAIAAPKIP